MKTKWDYTSLAASYIDRPPYSELAIDQMLSLTSTCEGGKVCDVGAGVGHLTLPLFERSMNIVAVEPNSEMRKIGIKRTEIKCPGILWCEGTGEHTGQNKNQFDLVTFGSSFNVTDRLKALLESQRILKHNGWFACMWNYRDLLDPLQAEIEKIIRSYVPEYSHGIRREDQSKIIKNSGAFKDPIIFEDEIIQTVDAVAWLEAWRSHATLIRQSEGTLDLIIKAIEGILFQKSSIKVPYVTRGWVAQRK
tara:strand:+ start:133 stop:879 length:747 start_codon:yes stop_codon:yes gene_type:complete